MKEGWGYKKLGDVSQSDLGKTLNSATDTGKLRPYLCAVNILWDKIDFTTLKKTKFEESELERYSIKKGDLLICEGGDVGRAAIWNSDETILYQNALHRVRFNKEIVPRFCLLYLKYLKNAGVLDNRYAKGVTIKHLVKSSLLSIPIPVPSINQQQRIVEELDLLSGIIEKNKTQLEELDKLSQSIFYDMFGDPVTNEKGWEKVELGSKCEVTSFKRVLIEDVVEEGIPFIRGTELTELSKSGNSKDVNFTLFITQEHYSRVKEISGVPDIGDLLIPSINSEGYIWILDTDKPMYYKDGRVLWVHVNHSSYSSYALKYIMQILLKETYSDMASGATFAELKLFVLRELKIILPPMILQQEFADKISVIESMKAKVRQSLKEAEQLFNSRMDYYFN